MVDLTDSQWATLAAVAGVAAAVAAVVAAILAGATLYAMVRQARRAGPRLKIVLKTGVHPGYVGPDAPMPTLELRVRNSGKSTRLHRFWLQWGPGTNERTYPPLGGQHALPGGGPFWGSGLSQPLLLPALEMDQWTSHHEPTDIGVEDDEGDMVTASIPASLRAQLRTYPGAVKPG